MGLPECADKSKVRVTAVITIRLEADIPNTGSMQPMPSDKIPSKPAAAADPNRVELRERLLGIQADLDSRGEAVAAVHVQMAINCLGMGWDVELTNRH